MAPWAAGPRARSVLQGHGVWALRRGPSTRAGPHDRAGLGKVRSWFLRCSEGDVWHGGLLARGPDPSSRAMVFGCVWALRRGPWTRAGPHFRAGLGKVRSWFLRCSEGDVWHGGLLARGPDPSSRAMVFGPCEGVPRPAPGRTSGLV